VEHVDTDAGDSGDDLMVRAGRASVLIASLFSGMFLTERIGEDVLEFEEREEEKRRYKMVIWKSEQTREM